MWVITRSAVPQVRLLKCLRSSSFSSFLHGLTCHFEFKEFNLYKSNSVLLYETRIKNSSKSNSRRKFYVYWNIMFLRQDSLPTISDIFFLTRLLVFKSLYLGGRLAFELCTFTYFLWDLMLCMVRYQYIFGLPWHHVYLLFVYISMFIFHCLYCVWK